MYLAEVSVLLTIGTRSAKCFLRQLLRMIVSVWGLSIAFSISLCMLYLLQSRTAAQRSKIAELTRVLSQPEPVIIALLEDCGWNVETAANKFYDSGVPARARGAKGGAGGAAVSAEEIAKEFSRLAPSGKMDDSGITKFAG